MSGMIYDVLNMQSVPVRTVKSKSESKWNYTSRATLRTRNVLNAAKYNRCVSSSAVIDCLVGSIILHNFFLLLIGHHERKCHLSCERVVTRENKSFNLIDFWFHWIAICNHIGYHPNINLTAVPVTACSICLKSWTLITFVWSRIVTKMISMPKSIQHTFY